MDFHSMKRKRLQSLCKKHGIPANLKNKDMADRLSLLFKGKENVVSCGSENAGSEKDMVVDVQTGELNSSNDMVTGNVDAQKDKFITSGKRSLSPNLEERVGFSPKLLKNSEIERLESKLNLSPEKSRDDIGICDEEGLHSVPGVVVMKDVDLVQFASEDFGDHLVEAEVDKLGDITIVHDDAIACGNGKSGAESEKQDDNNSPQGSNVKDLNILQVSPEESGDTFIEGEVHNSDDNVSVHGGTYNARNDGSEADNMWLDTSIGAKDTDGKANVTDEHFLDEVHSSNDVKSSDPNISQMVISGTDTGNADACELKFVSPPKLSLTPDSERIGFSPMLLHNSETKGLESGMNLLSPETPKDDIGLCDVEENMQEWQVNHIQEVLHAVPSPLVDLVQVSTEEFGNHFVEIEVEKLGDKTVLHENVCGTGKGGSEAAKQDDTNSPQGSNINDVNPVHVSPEESSYPLVDREVQKSDVTNCVHGTVYNSGNSGSEVDTMYLLDTSIENKDTDKKTNVTMEDLPDEVISSSFKYSGGTPDQVLTTYPLSEVKSSDLNIHRMVGSDTCEERLESPQKKGLVADPNECIGFDFKHLEASEIKGFEAESNFDPSTLGGTATWGTCNVEESMQSVKTDTYEEKLKSPQKNECFGSDSKHLEASEIKGFEAESNFDPSTLGDIATPGTCDMKESMQSIMIDVVAHPEQCIGFSPKHLEASVIACLEAETNFNLSNVEDILGDSSMEESLQNSKNEKVYYSEEALQTTVNSVVINDVDLLQRSMEECNLLQGEFTKLFDNSDAGGTGAEEEENQLYMLSSKGEKRDMDILGEYFLNKSQSVDNSGDQNSDKRTPDKVVQTMPQPDQNKSSTFNFHQMFASGTASGDEDVCQDKLESPPKCTPNASSHSISFFQKLLESSTMKRELEIETNLPFKSARDTLGTCDMKENINMAKKEQDGTVISKKTFPKRQPLQDLKQK